MYLSTGRRFTLLKSLLSGILTNFLFLFIIPTNVANRIEKIQWNFLWGGREGEFKFQLVNWNLVCSPINFGGLEVRKLSTLIMAYWISDYGGLASTIWVGVGWMNVRAVRSLMGVVYGRVLELTGCCFLFSFFILGDGTRFRFWHNVGFDDCFH